MIVGIDVAKASFDAVFEIKGRLWHETFAYTEAGLAALLEKTPIEAHYVMEATGVYHARLALWLYAAKRQVSVLNPLAVKRFAQMQLLRVKSDKADASLLRQYGLTQTLIPWAPAAAEVLELQQAHAWLDDLIRERTRLINREEAHAHRHCGRGAAACHAGAQLWRLEYNRRARRDRRRPGVTQMPRAHHRLVTSRRHSARCCRHRGHYP